MRAGANEQICASKFARGANGQISSAQVNAMCAAGQRNVHAVIHDHSRVGGARHFHNFFNARDQVVVGHIFLAYLNHVGAAIKRAAQHIHPRKFAQRLGQQHAHAWLKARGRTKRKNGVAFQVVHGVSHGGYLLGECAVKNISNFLQRSQRLNYALARGYRNSAHIPALKFLRRVRMLTRVARRVAVRLQQSRGKSIKCRAQLVAQRLGAPQ